MYQDPGYNVFNWRGEEGIDKTRNGLKQLNQQNHQWQQQQSQADEQRRQKEIAEAAARANQYGTASQGVGPTAFQPASEPDPKTMYQTSYDPTSSVIY